MGAFSVAFHWWIPESSLFRAYLHANAAAAATVLGLFGEHATVTGTLIVTPSFPLQIRHGCDALQSSAFLVFAVLASPVVVPWASRLTAIAFGVLSLGVLNVFRILTLYYVGVLAPAAFEWVHIDVWQAVFVFAPIAIWLMWLQRRVAIPLGRGRVPG